MVQQLFKMPSAYALLLLGGIFPPWPPTVATEKQQIVAETRTQARHPCWLRMLNYGCTKCVFVSTLSTLWCTEEIRWVLYLKIILNFNKISLNTPCDLISFWNAFRSMVQLLNVKYVVSTGSNGMFNYLNIYDMNVVIIFKLNDYFGTKLAEFPLIRIMRHTRGVGGAIRRNSASARGRSMGACLVLVY